MTRQTSSTILPPFLNFSNNNNKNNRVRIVMASFFNVVFMSSLVLDHETKKVSKQIEVNLDILNLSRDHRNKCRETREVAHTCNHTSADLISTLVMTIEIKFALVWLQVCATFLVSLLLLLWSVFKFKIPKFFFYFLFFIMHRQLAFQVEITTP